ncbi:glutathione S-transferase family protein [Alphaproteobacteria bacterium]|nr:glutathione S-transferase family protein [Alphaproteobacteria bacterium]
MQKLQLIYFNLRALCEAPRMMLHKSKINYSYEMAWDYFRKPWKEIKKDIPFYKMPLLVVDEKVEIWQSNTISRYIAKITNNLPEDSVMAAYADSIFESAHDLFFPLNPTINVFIGDTHLTNKQKLIHEILPSAFHSFDKIYSKYDGNFFLGDKSYYCDFNVYHHFSLALLLDSKILDNFSNLKNFMTSFEKIDGIKDYLENRPQLIDIGTKPKFIIDKKEYPAGANPNYSYDK